MIITYYGHALFSLETADGHVVVTDPYDASVGYPMGRLRGDVVTVSHEHHDHNNLSLVEGNPIVLRGTGARSPLPGVTITGFPSFHDDQEGTKRGANTMFMIETDGLRVLLLGDLGHNLDGHTVNTLGRVDLLMVPVGGYYTIGAAQAAALCRTLMPRVILPMHYRTESSGRLPIAGAEDFLAAMEAHPSPMPLIRVTREDLSQQPPVALLTPKPLPRAFYE